MMASLSGMTLAEMRAATAAQIKTAVKARIDQLTKAQLIRLELWVREWEPGTLVRVRDADVVAYRQDGQIESLTNVERNESGALISRRRVDWTYYPTGEVDTIIIVETDAAGAETSRRTIKHHTDGRQPSEV